MKISHLICLKKSFYANSETLIKIETTEKMNSINSDSTTITPTKAIVKIKKFFAHQKNRKFETENQHGTLTTYKMRSDGIEVSNLGNAKNNNFLPWGVFYSAVELLIEQGGTASRGNVMGTRLGDASLPLNSIEGRIAERIYGKQVGDTVFRRSTPVATILIASQVCVDKRGDLTLL